MMTGFDNLTNSFTVSSTALKMFHSLVEVAFCKQKLCAKRYYPLKGRVEQFKLIDSLCQPVQ